MLLPQSPGLMSDRQACQGCLFLRPPQVQSGWEERSLLGLWSEQSQWKAKGWIGLKAPAGRLAGEVEAAGAGEAGSAPLLLGGPDARSPAQGPRKLLNSGNKAAVSAWVGDVPLSMLVSSLVSSQPSAFPVLRERCGWWAKERSTAVASKAFSTSGLLPLPLQPPFGWVGPVPVGADFFPLCSSFGRDRSAVHGFASRCRCLPAVAPP